MRIRTENGIPKRCEQQGASKSIKQVPRVLTQTKGTDERKPPKPPPDPINKPNSQETVQSQYSPSKQKKGPPSPPQPAQNLTSQYVKPNNSPNTIAVKIPAPTLSPVVVGSVCDRSRAFPLPADGSPLLVPPVVEVKGGTAIVIRLDCSTSITDKCSPSPPVIIPNGEPSYLLSTHARPQVKPSGAPVQVAAAAFALAWSLGRIHDWVNGAIW